MKKATGAMAMSAIILINADHATAENNQTAIPDNPATQAVGAGIWLTNVCCGRPSFDPGSSYNTIANNNERGAEFAFIVDPGNTTELTLRGNFGNNVMEGQAAEVKKEIKIARELGQIDNDGIAESLLKKADNAEAAVNSGQRETAKNILNALIQEMGGPGRQAYDGHC
ncbi:MAG: hypothetical protein HY547_10285 [Elusimicrobia bacterium]|nr:hypothetical protein [Elusimicrobiota bacterium]